MTETTQYGLLLREAGLIQFGRFEGGAPLKFSLELLPSYPRILQILADGIATVISEVKTIERIVCTSDASAIGIAVSLKMGIPLVYSRGQGQLPVHDLVGAYDVGHPTALITTVLGRHHNQDLARFSQRATTVGLNIVTTVSIISLNLTDDADIHTLINLPEFVEYLGRSEEISREVVDYLSEWLNVQGSR